MTDPTVTLSVPIRRGESTITEVLLRHPKGGDLRGLTVPELSQGNYLAIRTLAIRIATPQLLETDIDEMSVTDVGAITGEIMNFFMTDAQRALVMQHFGLDSLAASTG